MNDSYEPTTISQWMLHPHPENIEDFHGKEQINFAIKQLLLYLNYKYNFSLRGERLIHYDLKIRHLMKIIREHELFQDIRTPNETWEQFLKLWEYFEKMSEKWEGLDESQELLPEESPDNIILMMAAFDRAQVQ